MRCRRRRHRAERLAEELQLKSRAVENALERFERDGKTAVLAVGADMDGSLLVVGSGLGALRIRP